MLKIQDLKIVHLCQSLTFMSPETIDFLYWVFSILEVRKVDGFLQLQNCKQCNFTDLDLEMICFTG